MKNFGNDTIDTINQIYTKCFKQSKDISDDINDIQKGLHPIGAINAVKTKVIEKLENYEENVKIMEKVVYDLPPSEQNKWKK